MQWVLPGDCDMRSNDEGLLVNGLHKNPGVDTPSANVPPAQGFLAHKTNGLQSLRLRVHDMRVQGQWD